MARTSIVENAKGWLFSERVLEEYLSSLSASCTSIIENARTSIVKNEPSLNNRFAIRTSVRTSIVENSKDGSSLSAYQKKIIHTFPLLVRTRSFSSLRRDATQSFSLSKLGREAIVFPLLALVLFLF